MLFFIKKFLFFSPVVNNNVIEPDLRTGLYKKIHGAIALTAIAPLLNLNLNYEKLRNKGKNKKLFINLHDTNFCIFKYQNLLSMVIKSDFCLQIGRRT